jgi:hypothetical protein
MKRIVKGLVRGQQQKRGEDHLRKRNGCGGPGGGNGPFAD